ncbi:MAG: CotH kinase family protein [Flavobacteriales bacterium]|nr:CotH kinase family protein [Flavobacteriales bacterium]
MKFTLWSFCLVIFSVQVHAQALNPEFGMVYPQDVIPRVYVTMDSADLAWLLAEANLESDEYKVASLRFEGIPGDTFLSDSVGIRLRGNTSRYAEKKSFKIHLEKFDGPKLHGIEKLNLKGSHNDPSILRERLSYQVMRAMNGAAARSNNVELYINEEYRGLYVNIEQIDNDFMKLRFGNKTGNLFKCLYGASLRSSDDVWNDGIFELKTNETANDRSDLIELIDKLNTPSDEAFKDEIETILDVDHLLKYLAVEVLTGHWDGYSFNKNNYYLYHNDSTDLFEVIMYDPDNTFGIDWFGIDWGERDLYDWGITTEDRPMFWRILNVPAYRALYTENLRFLLNGAFHPDSIFPIIDALHAQNFASAMNDAYYPLDYGFDSAAYALSTTAAFGAHVKYGIKPFIATRHASALEQLDYPFAINEAMADDWSMRHSTTNGAFTFWNEQQDLRDVELLCYDLKGSLITTLAWGNLMQHERKSVQLPAGVYVANLRHAEGSSQCKIVVP